MSSLRRSITLSLGFIVFAAPLASAQTKSARTSIALEADALSYFIGGYSGIINVSFANKLMIAAGSGRYEVPTFMLEADPEYEAAKWKATSTSVQVVRVGYRFKGPHTNGPVLGLVVLNQNWRLRSETTGGETRFRPVSGGVTAGYYHHIGRHFYIYPTFAFTNNRVVSGSTTVGGSSYTVAKWGPNGSLHAGWEFR
jgi:hypothetical protein